MPQKTAKRIYPLWWIIAVLAAIYANTYSDTFQPENSALFASTAISAILVYKVTRWADAYEHETRESLIWAGVFGCGISVIVALLMYGSIPDDLESALVVSLVEESSKALVLVPLIFLQYINSWTDGLVFGSLTGLGFSISEDFWYALDSENPLETIVDRQIYSIFGHSLFSALFFAAICALYLHAHKSIFITMSTLAIGAHWLWNTGLDFIDSNDFFLYAIVPPLAFLILGFCLRLQERNEIMNLGQVLVESGSISTQDMALAVDLKNRKTARRQLSTSSQRREFDEKIKSDVKKILGSAKTESL
jgi:RsiW-degrading membrane proteinase PrsW (M82 family)